MKSARITVLLAVLLGASSVMGVSRVTNVLLSHEPGQTVAHIDVEGEVRFAHQVEIAKDGKPHRVIVDILSATHHLGGKTFRDVPKCIVQAVRTSQYSVTPEKTVRVVFDMDHETVYQIVAKGQHVKVSFPDPKAKAFAEWSTHQVVMAMLNTPAKTPEVVVAQKSDRTAAELNSALDSDRMASLAGDRKVPTKAQRPVQKPTAQAAPAPVKNVAVEPLTGSARQYSDRSQFEIEVEAPTVLAAAPKPIVTKAAPQPKVASAVEPTPKKVATKKAIKQSKPVSSKPLVLIDKPSTPQPKKKTPAVKKNSKATPAKADSDEPTAKLEETKKQPAKSTKKAKSTARFRRSPVESSKIKGSLVAEFPQRLVIKYASKGYRDPFETLINEARVFDSPMAERIPNIDGLKLVGVIESFGDENSALFEDGDSYSYILRAGDKVRKGYVLRVEQDRVFFQIFEYGWSRTVAMNIED